MESSPIIQTHELGRDFTAPGGGILRAVQGVDLSVPRGQTLAILGPNGAGKSTLMRMLTTLLPASTGTAEVAGFDVAHDPSEVRSRLGHVGQGGGAGEHQRVRDEVVTQGRIHRMSRSVAKQRADELLEVLELSGLAQRTAGTLSGGQRRRLDLALGLVHVPEILILDEPTTGLDPQSRANLWQHIARMRDEHGMTVVVTTHYLDEADLMAERVVVIDHGRIIADDTPSGLKRGRVGDRIELWVADRADVLAAELALLPGVSAVSEVDPHHERGPMIVAHVDDAPVVLPRAVERAGAAGVHVVAAEARPATLDDVFLNLTGRSLRDGEPNTGAAQEPAAQEVVS